MRSFAVPGLFWGALIVGVAVATLAVLMQLGAPMIGLMTDPRDEHDAEVIGLPILGDWASTESTIDPVTGERSDPFETISPAAPE